MTPLLQAFLTEALRRCERLRENLQSLRSETSSSNDDSNSGVLLEMFRQIHTLKGSAAAFELENVSRLAHEIEQCLETALAHKIAEPAVFTESLSELEDCLRAAQAKKKFELSQEKVERWRKLCFSAQKIKKNANLALHLPAEFYNRLKNHEQLRLQAALSQNASVYLFEINLPTAGFAEKFRSLHAQLSKCSEIVATLPNNETCRPGTIRMHLICAANETQTENLARSFAAHPNCRIVSVFGRPTSASARSEKRETSRTKTIDVAGVMLSDIWATPLAAAANSARRSGKSVRFETCGGEIEIAGDLSESCETVLLHLLCNAVFHGVEAPEKRRAAGKNEKGVVSIAATRQENEVHLKIADDGIGIDVHKVWEVGVRRGFFNEEKTFDRAVAEQLIFYPGVSTATVISLEAGRGIGLDAVTHAVKKVNGNLTMTSEPGRGTTFLVRLPAF